MIVTVTMNPAIDRTIDIPVLQCGALNRITHVENDAGGKGINVSKTIKALGGKSIATGFIGGNAGNIIENTLTSEGIEHDFIRVNGDTRTNTKVVEEGGRVTELNEKGPKISEYKINQLMDKLLSYASEETLFVLAGSIPEGVEKDIYGKITNLVHKKGAKVFVDADGELFVKSLEAKPDYIKPNDIELAEYCGIKGDITREEIVKMAENLIEKGIGNVIVSMGKDGAAFISHSEKFMCEGLKVKAHSTVGAGDAMVAAVSYGIADNMSFRECASLGIATSAGAVTTIGTKPPSRELIDELIKGVSCKEF